ncbi:MAG TPA: hypothetical protein VJZ27_18550, partial [Aggregatilineales bacterium]|nr:hypothetical protein [Aggregatilineales bacterium]
MGIQTDWDNEAHTIIRRTYGETLNIDEMLETLPVVQEMVAGESHVVHMVHCFPERVRIPRDLLFTLHRLQGAMPENTGLSVLVGGGTTARAMIALLRRLVPPIGRRLRLAASIEDARVVIAEAQYNRAAD